MQINNKLRRVSKLVKEDSSFLDIGCDHALLDIYLAKDKEKKFKKIVASDNKEGPLEIAKKNITKYQLQNKIELRLGNGLDVYTDDIDTIIISGMGGRNIIGIFKSHIDYLKKINTIILSPNNYQEDVRIFLTKNNFYIDEEILVKEGKVIYQIIRFIKGKKKYNKKELFFGPILINKKDNIFKEYYKKELLSRKIILKLLPKGFSMRKYKIKKEIKMLEKELI